MHRINKKSKLSIGLGFLAGCIMLGFWALYKPLHVGKSPQAPPPLEKPPVLSKTTLPHHADDVRKKASQPKKLAELSDSLRKVQARQAFRAFLASHPYGQNKHLSYDEWKTIPKPDRPDLAAEQDYLRTLDPRLGYVPHERKLHSLKAQSLTTETKAAIGGITWQERGPNNIGGRTRALLFDPTDGADRKVWAGGIQGGLWYTQNITIDTLWTKVNDLWDNISITALAADPNNDNTWYLGTGESFTTSSSSSTRGAGLWKTTDAGTTWTHLSTANGFFNTDAQFHYVNDIIVRDEGGGNSALFVAVGRRFLLGTFTEAVGLYRSTDGGVNFSQVLPTSPDGFRPYEPADLELDANNRIWVGTRENSNLAGGGVIAYSATGLGGSWTLVDFSTQNNAWRVELACSPSDPDVVYAVARNSAPTTPSQDVAWLKRTLNATQAIPTWEDMSIPNYLNSISCSATTDHFTRGQAFYDLIMAVHPTDPARLTLGGISLHQSTNATNATVGNVTFSPISYWTGNCHPYVHADAHQIVYRPNHNDEAIIGSDGGVSYSDDLGSASAPLFANRNNHYNVTQFYAADAANIAGGGIFLAGSQDNGTQQFSSGLVSASLDVSGGDGGFCHFDQDNSDIRITSYIRNIYFVSSDGGETYTEVHNDINNGLFINPSEYDDGANILYANLGSSNSISRISDIGGSNTHTNININFAGTLPPDITALKASPHTAHRLFLGGSDGTLYQVDNANTATPTTVQMNSTPTIGSISCIDIGDNDNELLVTFFNYGVNSVWETSNGGTNWNNKEGDLPDIPVRWALYNPDNRDEVLLATELGIYSSDNFNHGGTGSPNWGGIQYRLGQCTL